MKSTNSRHILRLALGPALGLAVLASVAISVPAPASSDTSWQSFNCAARAGAVTSATVTSGSTYDVVIYGGTPSGAAAALAAANLGKKVLLLSEGTLFGGAISNGLGATDLGSLDANVGTARLYLNQLSQFYHNTTYRTEPKVAECIFEGWLTSSNITLGTNTVLDAATVTNRMISDLTLHSSANPDTVVKVTGKDFVDASYAGDLMNLTGAANRLGMSDYYRYNESVTKYRSFNVLFKIKDPAVAAQAAIDFAKLPQVTSAPSLENYPSQILGGQPSFTYRLCVTKQTANLIPFAKTADYETWAPAWRTFMKYYYGFNIQKSAYVKSNGTVLTQLWRIAKLPNNKYDLNAYFSSFTNLTMNPSFFSDLQGRAAILTNYSSYLQSFLWFVQNDPSVPALEHNALNGFGLCADEFTSTGGWPQAPYLREGRRLIGQTTMTTKDIFVNRVKPDGIAVGSYTLDSKPTLFVFANNTFARDRSLMFRAPMYEIPLSAMLSKAGPKNLIVSIGLSASPAAYASIRMEPQFIQLGQAAGIAASLASNGDGTITDSLATSVRGQLAMSGGFNGITSICQKLSASLRTYWGFNQTSCQTIPFGLYIAG